MSTTDPPINLRSDTQTLPTPAMLEAIARAPLGDDTYDEVAAAIRGRDLHYPRTRLLCLENTHNRSGGRVVPVERHRELCRVAHERGLSVHLDGARIFNAAIAAGVPVTEYTKDADSVMVCLTKGLSCPVGSVLAGSREFVQRADEARRRLGGGMRQAGVIAAPGIVALETMVERLADDHRNARRLAEGIAAVPGLAVELEGVETNMVVVDHRGTGLETEDVLRRLAAGGVIASGRPPYQIRLVTNRHHDEAVIDAAIARTQQALGAAM